VRVKGSGIFSWFRKLDFFGGAKMGVYERNGDQGIKDGSWRN